MESVAFVLLVQGIQDEKKRIKKEQDEEGKRRRLRVFVLFFTTVAAKHISLNGETNWRFGGDPAGEIYRARRQYVGYPLFLCGACSHHFRTGSARFYRLELSFRANQKGCLRKIALNNAFDHIDFIQLESEL